MEWRQNADAFRKDAEQKYGEMTGDFLKIFPANNDEEATKSVFCRQCNGRCIKTSKCGV